MNEKRSEENKEVYWGQLWGWSTDLFLLILWNNKTTHRGWKVLWKARSKSVHLASLRYRVVKYQETPQFQKYIFIDRFTTFDFLSSQQGLQWIECNDGIFEWILASYVLLLLQLNRNRRIWSQLADVSKNFRDLQFVFMICSCNDGLSDPCFVRFISVAIVKLSDVTETGVSEANLQKFLKISEVFNSFYFFLVTSFLLYLGVQLIVLQSRDRLVGTLLSMKFARLRGKSREDDTSVFFELRIVEKIEVTFRSTLWHLLTSEAQL